MSRGFTKSSIPAILGTIRIMVDRLSTKDFVLIVCHKFECTYWHETFAKRFTVVELS